jgi:hypothetical protein
MRHKLTKVERAERIDRRAREREEKAARRQTLRDWFDARREAADKRRKDAAKAPRGPRGVDRVPARYRMHVPAPVYVVEHHDMPRDVRRARGYRITSGNTPHVNPARDTKRHARLRKELQS